MHEAAEHQGIYTSVKELAALRARATGFSFLPRQPIHSVLAGRHASRLRGRGLNFEEIRAYLPGDDIRQIDWKVTARTRKPHSRIYTEERERTTLLFVDQRLSMFFGSVKNMKSVTAAEAAAIAAWRVIKQKDRVGAIVFNDDEIKEIRPQRSQSCVLRILGEIVRQNQSLAITPGRTANPAKLNEALQRCTAIAKHDCLVVLFTDAFGHDDRTSRLLTRIAQHNDVLMIAINDPLEANLPSAGRLIFGDGVRQLEVNTSDRRLTETFRQRFADTRAAAKRFLLHRETPVIELTTDRPIPEQVRRKLGVRGR